MHSEHSAKIKTAARSRAFAVNYGRYLGLGGNSYLMGTGTVEIDLSTSELRFSGKRRAFWESRKIELLFTAKQLWNLTCEGRYIRFETLEGKSGKERWPFLFRLRSKAEAIELAGLLGLALPPLQTGPLISPVPPVAKGAAVLTAITFLLLSLNVVVFLYLGLVADSGFGRTFDAEALRKYGANNGALVIGGEWWRLLTSMFLHASASHLLSNMAALYFVGGRLELLFGKRIYTLIYFACGIVGGLTSIVVHGDQSWTLGASGAIFGLYGALLGFILRQSNDVDIPLLKPIAARAVFFLAVNLYQGLRIPMTDLAAHGGGFALGVILGLFGAVSVDATQTVLARRRRVWLVSLLSLFSICGVGLEATRANSDAKEEREVKKVMDEKRQAEQAMFYAPINPSTFQNRLFLPPPSTQSLSTSDRDRKLYRGWIDALEQLKLREGGPANEERETALNDLKKKMAAIDLTTQQIAFETELLNLKYEVEGLLQRLERSSRNEINVTEANRSLAAIKMRIDRVVATNVRLAQGKSYILQQIDKAQQVLR